MTRVFGENVKSKVLYFSSQRILEEGIYLENGQIVLAMNGEKTPVCHVDELNILGTHNHENAMAATGMAAAYGVPVDVIRRTLKEFQGVNIVLNMWQKRMELYITMIPREQTQMQLLRGFRR